MNKPNYTAVDAQVFAELDKTRALNSLVAEATTVCASEGCSSKWEHTQLCNEMWRAVAAMKKAAA